MKKTKKPYVHKPFEARWLSSGAGGVYMCFGSFEDLDNDASGNLQFLPGNSKIAWSWGVYVNHKLRGNGIGQAFLLARMQWCRENCVQCLMCSVDSDNAAQKHILAKHGWKMINEHRYAAPWEYNTPVEFWSVNLFPQTNKQVGASA